MRLTSREVTVWAPRIVGLGLAAFLSLFALDAVTEFHGVMAAVIAVVMGLAPAIVVLATVWLGWRHEGIAAAIFLALAIFYSLNAREHPQWIALIAGPLLLEAGLFFLSWRIKPKGQQRTAAN